MLLRKKKFNKKIYNVHVIILIVLKNVNSFNFEEKNETFLRLNATSIKMKESEISMTLKFNIVRSTSSTTR